jgi:hypothetical protein
LILHSWLHFRRYGVVSMLPAFEGPRARFSFMAASSTREGFDALPLI